MTALFPSSEKAVSRPARAHRRSRQGCGNCKLRKVKCDEIKPSCKRCTIYRVFCNYDSQYSDLQLSANGAFNIEMSRKFPYSLNSLTPSPISPFIMQEWGKPLGSNASYQFKGQDLELLSKFQTRTVLTITTGKSLPIYQNEIIKLACSFPFLMHAVLALTLMHDRHLSIELNPKQTTAEAFHWYRSIVLFNSKLSGLVQPSERDALWATAALFGVITFGQIEAKTPEEAWPLASPSSLDLNWLRMSDGKKEIWNITQPFRADCVFQALALEYNSFLPTPKGPGLEALPSELVSLYGLDATSTVGNNPYYAAASTLAKSLNIDCEYTTILNFFSFVRNMSPDYRQLLEQKDSRALLLLAYFYAQICRYQHWWARRTVLECQAICIYLERYHRHETSIQILLQIPKLICNDSVTRGQAGGIGGHHP